MFYLFITFSSNIFIYFYITFSIINFFNFLNSFSTIRICSGSSYNTNSFTIFYLCLFRYRFHHSATIISKVPKITKTLIHIHFKSFRKEIIIVKEIIIIKEIRIIFIIEKSFRKKIFKKICSISKMKMMIPIKSK